MANCLVTGGAGFIGSHVVVERIKLGDTVVVLDDLSGGFLENVPQNAIFANGSILDIMLIDKLFQKYNFDFVFHLGAYAAEGLSHFIRHFNYLNNTIGSVNLINASVKYDVKCFVFTSSIAVYGAGQLPMSEEMIPAPEDPYGISKYSIELDLRSAKNMFGLNSIIFRPHNVYGEHQNIADRYRNVIGIFMNQLMQDKPLTVFGDGTQTRAFSYIGDIAPTIATSVNNNKAYNQVFNIGSDVPYSINDMIKIVSNAFNKNDLKIDYLPARNEVIHAYSEHTKLEEIFGNKAKTSLEEGINRMTKWVKIHGARSSKKFDNIELYKNFPKSWL